jgi:voltage-gated potassium channel
MGRVKIRMFPIKASRSNILTAFLLGVLVVSTLIFAFGERYNIIDASYNTLCSVSWAHCDPGYDLPGRVATLILALTTWTVLAVLVESGVESFLHGGGIRMQRKIDGMKDHFIVCGYGSLGKTIGEALRSEGVDYVVLDADPKVTNVLMSEGTAVIEGDARDVKILERAGVRKARMVISALGSDADNVFLALTAKELNPQIRIATRAYAEESVSKLHRAGAEFIVMPEIIGGLELAKEILNLDESHLQRLVSKRSGVSERKRSSS